MRRIIMHIDMDCFFAQIEERENPRFKGKPVVVGAEPKFGKGRGVVSTCNYEARKYGIRSALPISMAFRACPEAIFLPVNMELYKRTSEKVMVIIKRYSPLWEVVSLDEAFLDLTSLGWEKATETAQRLKQEILKKEKLTSTVGLGPNKMVAKMATNKAKPNGFLAIKPSEVIDFLDPMGVEKIPGVGPKTAIKLRQLGALRIKDIRKIPAIKLREVLGKTGENIYQKAKGIAEDTVISEETVKSIGAEHTFEQDTRDPEIIFPVFENLIKEVYGQAVRGNFLFRTVTVVCRFQGFETHTKSKTFKLTPQLSAEAKKLLLQFIVENTKLIRLVGVRIGKIKKHDE
ncbi:MAG: DNA polymerase IV [Candidatus Nealsonbacteria bacterium]|nr:DNA polymerase IV [Candidatus Nealsonbacteria bacterium]